MENYYQILGVQKHSTSEEIKNRYYFLAMACHPDRITDKAAKIQAENEMKRINLAYSILSNPVKRQEHDKQLLQTQTLTPEQSKNKAEKFVESTLAFLAKTSEKWAAAFTPLPQDKNLKKTETLFFQEIREIIQKNDPSVNPDTASPLEKEISEALLNLEKLHVCLGAEICENGLPSKFRLADLNTISLIPLQNKITPLLNKMVMTRIITDDKVDQIIDNISQIGLALCSACQAIGREYVFKQQPQLRKRQAPRPPAPRANQGKSLRILGWGFLSLMTISLAVCALMVFNGSAFSLPAFLNFENASAAVETPMVLNTISGALFANQTPAPSQNCRTWDDIRPADTGKTLCVTGVMLKYYEGENGVFFVTFSKDTNDFRLLASKGEDLGTFGAGSCIKASGEVKAYGKMPYLEMNGPLKACQPQ
jgi:hypothetical protein